MPLYEYYCNHCDGVFELLRSMREAAEPGSCPLCDSDSQRIMPTSFSAFTFRDGMARRIPDDFKYWHGQQKVKTMNTGGVPIGEHPETYVPDPTPTLSKGDIEVQGEIEHLKGRHLKRMRDASIPPPMGPDGKPFLSPEMGQ